ncbi:MAG: hypothetical protein B7C24_17405 [Bacteroidetes bacterium 4572_77]|nr:MAG: hypothetical protein B7C24_17405 [Bacteroidetes bacterium 4572_77]
MGWWKITDIKTGSIDWDFAGKNVGNINALPENTTNELVTGDGPANIMEDAIYKIRKEYKAYWKREPTKSELQAVLNFVTNPLKLKQ